MEDDYNLDSWMFSRLGDLFLDCVCGGVPKIVITAFKDTCEVMYEVICPNCGKSCGMVSMHDLDFCTMAEGWNSMIPED